MPAGPRSAGGDFVSRSQDIARANIAKAEASAAPKSSYSRSSAERRDYAIARRNWDGNRNSSSYYTSGMYDEES